MEKTALSTETHSEEKSVHKQYNTFHEYNLRETGECFLVETAGA
jgi:hypothetical protein